MYSSLDLFWSVHGVVPVASICSPMRAFSVSYAWPYWFLISARVAISSTIVLRESSSIESAIFTTCPSSRPSLFSSDHFLIRSMIVFLLNLYRPVPTGPPTSAPYPALTNAFFNTPSVVRVSAYPASAITASSPRDWINSSAPSPTADLPNCVPYFMSADFVRLPCMRANRDSAFAFVAPFIAPAASFSTPRSISVMPVNTPYAFASNVSLDFCSSVYPSMPPVFSTNVSTNVSSTELRAWVPATAITPGAPVVNPTPTNSIIDPIAFPNSYENWCFSVFALSASFLPRKKCDVYSASCSSRFASSRVMFGDVYVCFKPSTAPVRLIVSRPPMIPSPTPLPSEPNHESFLFCVRLFTSSTVSFNDRATSCGVIVHSLGLGFELM